MGSLVHDIIYVEKYTLEIAHEKIYEDKNRPVMCGIVSIRHRIFCFPEAKCEYTAICRYSERSRFMASSMARLIKAVALSPIASACSLMMERFSGVTRTFISTNRSLYFLFARLRASESFEWVVFSSLMVFPPTMCCCRSKKSITQNGT